MKIGIFTILFLVFTTMGLYSQNLVMNPSFEEFNDCPTSISQLQNCKYWSTPNAATTDFFHSCSNTFSSTQPINAIGVQKARTGNGYIGIITYQKNMAYTELAQCKLKEPLEANKYYKVSYYVSAAEATKYFSHAFGAYFSKDSVSQDFYHFQIENKRYLIKDMNTQIINSTDKWVLISGIYKAKGGEEYLTIGNVYGYIWKGSLEKNKERKSYIREKVSYYYIDDVSVTQAKSKRDRNFDSEVVTSENEIEVGKEFIIANTENLFHKNSSEMLNLMAIIKQAQQDTGFVPEVAFLEYFANFMRQNPSVEIEVRVYSDSENNNQELATNRASQVVKYLKKKKVKKKRMTAVGVLLNEENMNEAGMVEIKIIKK
jgi:outer membrane protein OmpA-like peptidoglycan-associated protein